MRINGLNPPLDVERLPGEDAPSPAAKAGKDFASTLKDSIMAVSEVQQKAESAVRDLAVGRSNRIHETMMALEEADLAFKLLLQVRNKALEAYREITRMAI